MSYDQARVVEAIRAFEKPVKSSLSPMMAGARTKAT
jgi:hypothetical protein